MPTFASDKQAKLINYLRHVDNLIEHHKKTNALLETLKHAIVMDCHKKTMPKDQKTITFDRNSLARLKRIYNKALKDGKTKNDVIKFEGNDLLIGYAKYLIEYLESRFKQQ